MGGRRVLAAVAAAGVLTGVLAGCSSGGSKSAEGAKASSASGSAAAVTGAATAPAAASVSAPAPAAAGATAPGTAAPAASAPASAPAPAAPEAPRGDLEAALLDDKVVAQVLPDARAMAGWEEEKRRVDTADHKVTCTGAAAASCAGKPLSGSVRFSSGDVVVRFLVDTLPSRDAAAQRLKESYASYAAGPFKKVDIPALGSESQAFQGPLAEGEGVGIVVRSGTVVASVTSEGGPVDVPATRRFAVMLVQRIEQAQAGKAPDAGLGVG
ncbi:hypothetical protein ABZW03_06730 [Kitasatospora sp. NPDC004799]|uniref:hypothetical protein n=1 Tax=Kitasatospora sp. NPDC004799 TaxID=3154460 RepID=UPI00339F00F1